MTYIDTNILVRIITGDDPALADRGFKLLANLGKKSVKISEGVLTELCFVLEFHDYRMQRGDICQALRTIFGFSQIVHDEITERVIDHFEQHSELDFVDCLLLERARQDEVITFDKSLQKAIHDTKQK